MSQHTRIDFLKTTFIGGIIFLLPLVVLALVIGEAIDIMLLIAEPMADFLPIDSLGGIALANLLALVGVVLICFIAGLLARRAAAGKAIKSLERKVMVNVPGYAMIKGITGGLSNTNNSLEMQAVLLTRGDIQQIGLETERLTDGRSVVYIPSAPDVWTGIIQVVPQAQIQYLDVPVVSIMDFAEQYGRGTEALLAKIHS